MKRKLYIILIILLLNISYVYSADTEYIKVKDIVIQGNKTVSEFEIRENLLFKEGLVEKRNIEKFINGSVKLLSATGYFDSVDFKLDKKDTSIIYLILKEKPMINDIKIIGIHNLKSSNTDTEPVQKIRQMFLFAFPTRLDDVKLKQYINKVKYYLKKEGYYFASINYYVEHKDNKNILIIDIFEGAQTKVKYLKIYSKEGLSGWDKWVMEYKFSTDKGDVFKLEEWLADIDKLKLKLWNRGYIKAKIYFNIKQYKTENEIGINVYLEHNDKYKIKDFTVSGNTIIKSDKLLKLVKIEKNKLFNYNNLMESIQALKGAYSEKGYIETKVEPIQSFDKNTVSFDFNIKEGNIKYIEDIYIKGSIKTRSKIIMRELLIKKGEVLNVKKLDLSRRNLVMLNYFDKVNFNILNGKDKTHKIIEIEIEEGRTGTLSFGMGYSSIDKLVGFVEVTKNNFDKNDFWTFTGKGQKVHIRAEFGGERQNYELGWSDPWFNDDVDDTSKASPKNPLYLGYNIYNLKRSPDDYDILRTGGNIKLGRRFGIYNRAYIKYQFERIKINNVDMINAPSDIITEVLNEPNNEKKENQSSITLDLVRNTTDSVRWPTLGYIAKISNEISGGFIGGDVDFLKTDIEYSYFIPSFKTKLGRQVIGLRIKGASIDNIFSSDDVPSYEKFYLGGADTVRGYGERDIKFHLSDGTSYGGHTELFFNLEYRIPLVKDTISTVIFYDGGTLGWSPMTIKTDNWRFGYGFGFRINTPMGPLRLDWARRINETYPGSNDKGMTEIHFNIGNTF